MKDMLEQVQGVRLSPQQRSLWRLQTRNPSVYHAHCAVRIEGLLIPELLQQAVRCVVARHEILRTAFQRRSAMRFPLQVIGESPEFGWREEDLSAFNTDQSEARLRELVDEASSRALDLEHGPPLSVTLVKASPSNSLLLLSLSSLCCDIVGLKLLVREIAHSYAASVRGEEQVGDAMQYADLSEWQNELFESEDGETGREFWRLQDIAGPLQLKLPYERQAPEAAFIVVRRALHIPPAISSAAIALAERSGTSTAVLILTCWQVLLSRLMPKPSVGVFFDGRDYKELKQSIGLLAKYLPVPARLEEDSSFSNALRRTDESVREVGVWQESFSWESVYDSATEQQGEDLFLPFCFDFDEQETNDKVVGLTFTTESVYACIDRFKIKLTAARRNDELVAEFHYDSQLFKPEDIDLLAGQFLKLLENAVVEPTASVGGIDIMTEEELERWLVEFNRTQMDYPADRCLHQLFEEQAARTPSRIAVSFGGQQLTYRELNAQANRLAYRLRRHCIGPDALVGLCAERSLEMLTAALGVLKAGGAYVPLDPTHPARRLSYLLEEASPAVILTQGKFKNLLPESEAFVICLEDCVEFSAEESEQNPQCVTTGDHLAYVIYTSGSTGQPKGVMIKHHGLVNYLQWCLKTYVGTGGQGAPVHSPLGFDLTVTSLFCPLVSGQEVALLDERPGIDSLSEALRARGGFSLVKITPAHLQALNETLPAAEAVGRADMLIIGGEALTAERLNFWRAHAPDTRLINEYGPTETVVGCCVYDASAMDGTTGAVPIGRPIFNTRIYLLDVQQRIAPVGIAGELYIGGAGVARGYLKRPDLTAEKFVPDPFGTTAGGRLYRTGDLARYLMEGEIEFLGRIDTQVKVRGFRIELGEIEAALNEHQFVKQSVVVSRDDGRNGARLVGYVVGEGTISTIELKRYVQERLPEYMVPESIALLEEIPLTTNGKIDRKRLPAVEYLNQGIGRTELEKGRRLTPIQEMAAGIFQEVLKLDRVGIHENFFEIGGHSLLATRVVSRVRATFDVEIGVGSVFEEPTIEGLSRRIEETIRTREKLETPPLIRAERRGRLPLSFAQQRLWFLDQLLPNNPLYNNPRAVRLEGRLNLKALDMAVNEIVRRHEILRTRIEVEAGEPAQVIDLWESRELVVECLTNLTRDQREEEVRRIMRVEAETGFNLSSGPLFRVKILNLGEDQHVVLFTMHHIVSDGWSMGVLIREVGALYTAYCAGKESPLQELPIQYADFAIWQRAYLRGTVLENEIRYWKEGLKNAAVLELPTDFARPAAPGHEGGSERVEIVGKLSEGLKALSQREGSTLFMVLMAAFKALLMRYSGVEDIVVGTVIANRTRREVEGLIGFFVNTLVIRTDLSGNPSFTELIRREREKCLGAYAHQDVPFEKLVEELNPERDMSRSPLFQVMMVLQNTGREELEIEGLKANRVKATTTAAQFDLMLMLVEGEENISGNLVYNLDLYNRETIARIARHFEQVVEEMVKDVEQRIQEIDLMSESERKQILEGWNATRRAYDETLLVHEIIEVQARRREAAIAVKSEQGVLSYGELNRRADRLAHYLRTQGVGREDLVGICAERSLEMVIAILGILKSGAAYVPIDPTDPIQRIEDTLKHAQVKLLLSQRSLLSRSDFQNQIIFCLNEEPDQIKGYNCEGPVQSPGEGGLAYVIYTSGSTGKPKGVMNTHSGIRNRLLWMQEQYELNESDRVLQKTPFSFDVSVWEFLWPLMTGAALVMARPGGHKDGEYLLKVIKDEEITTIHFVPSMLAVFLEQRVEEAKSLRRVICSGEALSKDLERRLRNNTQAQVSNLYGPTEAAIDVTYWISNEDSECEVVPIGRPIANIQMYVFDQRLEPAPVGVRGEIYISGMGLARGYLGSPELTGERFVPNPYNKKGGGRIYRTGDMGRYLSDGNIEFLGRADEQVKVRGYRIELGEIETAIGEHPGVDRCAVVVSEDEQWQKRLVAYVTSKNWYKLPSEAYRLPGGLAVVEQDRKESEFLSRGIFEQQQYIRHGIEIKEDSIVFDVGANIGLFTIFVSEYYPKAKVYAFEPIEEICKCLRQNSSRYGARARVFQYGLSDAEGEEVFRYYPSFPAMSRMEKYSSEREYKELVNRCIRNERRREEAGSAELLEYPEESLDGYFEGQAQTCRLRRLSDVMKEQGVKWIDLLKINVERAEADVLLGIEEEDWANIDQIVMEAHHDDGAGKREREREIAQQLKSKGYIVEVEADKHLKDSGLYRLYARRNGRKSANRPAPFRRELNAAVAPLTAAELRQYLQMRLPEYMVPNIFIELKELPLTSSGKLDRKRLPSVKDAGRQIEQAYVAPRTLVEEILIGIFEALLKVDRIGIRDNFFRIGGHSLLATQVVSRIRSTLGVNIALRSIFDGPTVEDLAGKIQEAMSAGERGEVFPLLRVERRRGLPLSFAQQRLWFIDQLQPGNPAYNISGALRLKGSLNLEALESVFNEIIRRHETLRTRFEIEEGAPAQVIDEWEPKRLEQVDLTAMPTVIKEEKVRRLAKEETTTGFDLCGGPLFRVKILNLDEDEHVVLLTMHHIVSDGWSMNVLIREVTALYEAFSNGRQSPLADLPIQYADYASWQRNWLQGETLEAGMDYWRQQLTGAPPILELQTDLPRPPVRSYRGAVESLKVSGEKAEAIRQLCRQEGVTLFMSLLAAFTALLSRYTNQDDIVIGSPIANRNRVEIEDLIGFFVNTLALRTDLSGDPSFRELLGRVREVALGAYAHQDVPFEKLVEEIQPERNLIRSPLFQVMFILQETSSMAAELTKLEMTPLQNEAASAKFDLSLMLEVRKGEIGGGIEYDTDLFEADTIRRMVVHLEALLDEAVKDPDRPITRLRILTEQEQLQILEEWNNTARNEPDMTLVGLFERQVTRTPETTAVECGEAALSYAELNRRANRLARRITGLGVKPGALVAICMDRSIEMAVGLLGVLKAGCAYLPLDPDYPEMRRTFMLEDSQAALLLSQRPLTGNLSSHKAAVLYEDEILAALTQESEENLNIHATIDDLAYVIYTSGSTGSPKGAMLTHAGIVNCLSWMQKTYSLDATDRFLMRTSLTFDPSVWELFWPLSIGGCVVLAEMHRHYDTAHLTQLIAERRVTSAYFVPSILRAFLEEPVLEENSSLKRVICGGDSLSIKTVNQFFDKLPAEFHHSYGPTETSIAATEWTCRRESKCEIAPIGKPLGNVQVYVLDSRMNLAPIGVSGELYIGGVCVGWGYLDRPVLTAERYMPNPFSRQAGERMYRTGDLVRWRGEEGLEFLGRLDYQVKVRGVRIELGEIETVLEELEAVREAVVVAHQDASGAKRLVAYVAPETGATVAINELRSKLREKLPEYMAPSSILTIESFPLTPGGKVDRGALPTPELEIGTERESFAPRTPVEEMLANIWAELLGVGQVGIHDNFFEMGGHSMLATQAISRTNLAFNVEASLLWMFDQPTVAAISQRIEAALRIGHGAEAPPLRAVSREQELPLSFAQQRLWFINQLEPGNTAYNILKTFRLNGNLNISALEQALAALVERHEALRTSFKMVEGRAVQVIADPEPLSLLIRDLTNLNLNEQIAEVQRLAAGESQYVFDLTTGPLMRISLLQVGAEAYFLLVTIHHIISDGWSMDILGREMTALYDAYLHGRSAPLAKLPIQYVDYAAWQREWMQGEALERRLTYWRGQLSDDVQALQLPFDRPPTLVPNLSGGQQGGLLPPELNARLRALSRRHGSTLFMTLLTAYNILLSRYSGQEKFFLGAPVAGRVRKETEALIGFFVNTLVLRADLTGNPTFLELLSRVREVALGAYAHQDIPFEKLVEEFQPERVPGRNPFFDVMINYVSASPMASQPLDALRQLRIDDEDLADSDVAFPLVLAIGDDKRNIAIQLWYQTALFTPQRIGLMFEQYIRLLEQIVEEPETAVNSYTLRTPYDVPLLPDPAIILPEPPQQSAPEMFFARVSEAPGWTAISQGDRVWTYEETAVSTLSLATSLLADGLQPCEVVAVTGDRCFGLIVSMMAVFSSRGTLLLIDPALPAERKRVMLREARAKYLLRIAELRPENTKPEDTWMLEVNPTLVKIVNPWTGRIEGEERFRQSEIEIQRPEKDDPAYVFFTSGTTGVPKGVLGLHKSLSHFLTWQRETFAVGRSDRSGQLTGLSFDVALRDILTPLISGATLCLPEDVENRGPEEILAWLEHERVTLLHAVPSLARFWLANRPEGVRLSHLRAIFFAGEPLSDRLVQRWREAFPESGEIINLYGPTETTLAKCYYRIPADPLPGVQPVGLPLPQTQALVLGAEDRLCGVGEVGEIVIRTPFRSAGYINAVADRFSTNPFREDEKDLLYRTGDRGRFLLDGTLEILGRIDNQVKIRGIRIEPEEIESVLRLYAGVSDAVVVAKEDSSGEKHLVAYIVFEESSKAAYKNQAMIIEELKRQAGARLPQRLTPTAIVLLDRLPLTANGKVDRRALPTPELNPAEMADMYASPPTLVEEMLAEIWAEALGVERIGLLDNFFDLGGHSLLVTKAIFRIRAAFNVELQINKIFEQPIIAGLARTIEDMIRKQHERPQLPSIKPSSRSGVLPTSSSQAWTLEVIQREGRPSFYCRMQSFTGRLDIAALERALSEVVRRHESLRTTFETIDGHSAQVVHPAQPQKLQRLDLSGLPQVEQEIRMRALADEQMQRPFDLARGPLFRTMLVKLGEDEHVLLYTILHLICDRWSMRILSRELATLYQAFSQGHASPLPDLPIQYADFAKWEREWLQDDAFESNLAYWRQSLKGAPTILRLPTDRPRPPIQTFRGATQLVHLPDTLQTSLKPFCRRESVTMYMASLATLNVLLHHYTGQVDILVGTAIAGRHKAEIENLIGQFNNLLVMRIKLHGDPTFRELLRQVRETALSNYAHQAMPIGTLIKELAPDLEPGYPPLAQVAFTLHHEENWGTASLGLTSVLRPIETGRAALDLLVSMNDNTRGLFATITYNLDLFDPATIERMSDRFTTLLEGVVEDSGRRISELLALIKD